MPVSALSFFSQEKLNILAQRNISVPQVKQRVADKTHADLLKSLTDLQMEFDSMYPVVMRNSQQRHQFLIYAHFCALCLAKYHENYGQPVQARQFSEKAKIIQELIEGNTPTVVNSAAKEKSFVRELFDLSIAPVKALKNSLLQASNLRSKAGQINMFRMMFMMARLTWLNLIGVFNNAHILERLSKLLNNDLSLEVLQKRLNSVQVPYNVLSVALFSVHALTHVAMMGKHMLLPSNGEKKDSTLLERSKFELKKRYADLLNDGVWANINLITNFPMLLGLNFPAIIAITVAFMGFDLALVLWLRYQENKRYQAKIEQLDLQIALFSNQDTLNHEEKAKLDILLDQKNILIINHQAAQAKWQMNTAAATLLACSFGTAFLVAAPPATIACLLLAAVAVSMYLSAGSYSEMVKKKGMYQLARTSEEVDEQAGLQEYRQAQKQFAWNLVKFTVMPTLIIGTAIFCWPAALALVLAYGAYQVGRVVVNTLASSLASNDKDVAEAEVIAEPENEYNGALQPA